MHSPEHAEDMAEARRLGGLRRRREVAISGAYDFVSLQSVTDIRRLLEVAVLDTLGLEKQYSPGPHISLLGGGGNQTLRRWRIGAANSRP